MLLIASHRQLHLLLLPQPHLVSPEKGFFRMIVSVIESSRGLINSAVSDVNGILKQAVAQAQKLFENPNYVGADGTTLTSLPSMRSAVGA